MLARALTRLVPSLLFAALTVSAAGCGPAEDLDSSAHELDTCKGAPYPIVLAHGMAGWDKIGPINYYFNVAADLRARGEIVVEARVSPFEPSDVRARQLGAFVDQTLRLYNACKVNLIGHSQGGLDARKLASSGGYGDRIAAVVTVSTPHRGTPIADAASGLIPGIGYDVINAILKIFGGITGAPGDPNLKAQLAQMTTENMTKRFNVENPDDARVRYYSVAGRSALKRADSECGGGVWANPSRVDLLDPLFVLPAVAFSLTSPNPFDPMAHDGLVSVASARWGKFLGCVPADHLDEIGQLADLIVDPISGYDHRAMYRKITDQLHGDGF